MARVPSLGGVTGFPADAIAALRKLPETRSPASPAACRDRRRFRQPGVPALFLL